MLVITVKPGESFYLYEIAENDNEPDKLVKVSVLSAVETKGGERRKGEPIKPQIRVSIDAPKEVTVHREKIFNKLIENGELVLRTRG